MVIYILRSNPPAYANPALVGLNIILQQILAEKDPRYSVLVFIEPFIPGALSSHAIASAWPHSSETTHVIQLIIQQTNATAADATADAAAGAKAKLVEIAAESSSTSVLPRYPNYSLQRMSALEFDVSNLAKLRMIEKKFNPYNIFQRLISYSNIYMYIYCFCL